jgi:hypothetical protein
MLRPASGTSDANSTYVTQTELAEGAAVAWGWCHRQCQLAVSAG